MLRDTFKPAAPRDSSTYRLMKRLLQNYVRPYARSFYVALFFMAIAAAMTAAIAQLMQPVLDKVLNGSDPHMIIPIGLAVFATFVVRGASTYIHVIVMNKAGQSIVADIQKDLFSHFMTLDLSFFHDNPSGQLISRVINDVDVLRATVSDCLTGLGKSLLTLIFLTGVMVYQDWKLTLAAFAIMPFAGGFIAYIGKRLRHLSGDTQQQIGNLADRLSQTFQGIRQVKAYQTEQDESNKAGQAIDRVKKLNIKAVRIGNLSTPVNEVLIGIVAAGIIVYGGYQVSAGNMTAGQLAAFLAAFTMAYEPLKKLARLNNVIQKGLGAAERIFAMMDMEHEIKDRQSARAVELLKPEIIFEGVSFTYRGGQGQALNSVSFCAPAGKVTALVGPSGSGKTTIINLIPRFYDIDSGDITINGHNIQDIRIDSLRAQISLVSQEITIFDDTIAANIAYGRRDATQDDIERAARLAAADRFIHEFPEGYSTKVGEDGVKLSGGQRQRLSIARALLHDAPILLLDEATSALDNESEQVVQQAFEELEKGRTTLVIAHRLSTVKAADNILVLDQGRIIEQGRHDELMNKQGLYANMYRLGLKNDET